MGRIIFDADTDTHRLKMLVAHTDNTELSAFFLSALTECAERGLLSDTDIMVLAIRTNEILSKCKVKEHKEFGETTAKQQSELFNNMEETMAAFDEYLKGVFGKNE